MKRFLLNNYISKTVLMAILMALLLVAGLDSLASLIAENDNYEGKYTFIEGVIYILMLFPSTVNQYVPFACLLGCLIGLGSLATNSELVVMRAAGVSTQKIIRMALLPAVIVLIFDMALQEWISPQMSRDAETRRTMLKYGSVEQKKDRKGQGIWFKDQQTFLHINFIDPAGFLYGATIFQFAEEGHLASSMYSKTAEYRNDTWIFNEVAVSKFIQNELEDKVVSSLENEVVLDINLTPELLKILVVRPSQLPPSGLYSYMQYLSKQKVHAGEYELEFWKKIFQPLAGIALVLVAASFIFGPLRESTTGYRVFMAVIVGIIFDTSQDLLGPSSLVFGFAPWLAILLPIVLYIAVGLFLIRRSA